jgi:hypothetical protein
MNIEMKAELVKIQARRESAATPRLSRGYGKLRAVQLHTGDFLEKRGEFDTRDARDDEQNEQRFHFQPSCVVSVNRN